MTSVLYESPRRVADLLKLLQTHLKGDRLITIARELTKKFETIRTDTLEAIAAWYQGDLEQHRGRIRHPDCR